MNRYWHRREHMYRGTNYELPRWIRLYGENSANLDNNNTDIFNGVNWTIASAGSGDQLRIRGHVNITAILKTTGGQPAFVDFELLRLALLVVGDDVDTSDRSIYNETNAQVVRRIRNMGVGGYPVTMRTKIPNVVLRPDHDLIAVLYSPSELNASREMGTITWFEGWRQEVTD